MYYVLQTKIYYDDNSKPFASSHTKVVSCSANNVDPSLSSMPNSSKAPDYAKIYGQFEDQNLKKNEVTKIERDINGTKRKSILDSLDEENDCPNTCNDSVKVCGNIIIICA